MGECTEAVLVLICISCFCSITESLCPGNIQLCENIFFNTSVDCTNLNVTLIWESQEGELYDVMYCDDGDDWIAVPGCEALATNQCYLTPMIPRAKLDNFNVVTINNSSGTVCGLDFMPYNCVTTGAPNIINKWSKRHEIFVAVSAPETPYVDDKTGSLYKLDDGTWFFDFKYQATLRSLFPDGSENKTQTEGPQELNEFHFLNLDSSTRYEVDIVAILDNKQGTEHAVIELETRLLPYGSKVAIILMTVVSSIALIAVIITARQWIKSSAKFRNIELGPWLSSVQRRYKQATGNAEHNRDRTNAYSRGGEVFDPPQYGKRYEIIDAPTQHEDEYHELRQEERMTQPGVENEENVENLPDVNESDLTTADSNVRGFTMTGYENTQDSLSQEDAKSQKDTIHSLGHNPNSNETGTVVEEQDELDEEQTLLHNHANPRGVNSDRERLEEASSDVITSLGKYPKIEALKELLQLKETTV